TATASPTRSLRRRSNLRCGPASALARSQPAEAAVPVGPCPRRGVRPRRHVNSEGIDCIPRRRLAQMRLERLTIDDVDPCLEQAGDVLLEPDVIENGHPRLRLDSTRMSISLSLRLSPRAIEPNRAAWATPRSRRAVSERRSVASTSSDFMV